MLVLVLLFPTQNIHQFILKIITEGPIFLIQPGRICSGIQGFDLCQDMSFGFPSLFPHVSTPTLESIAEALCTYVTSIYGIPSPPWRYREFVPDQIEVFHKL
jgi:hypothetical protein